MDQHAVTELQEANHAHRHDFHIFLIARNGSATMEVDFERYDFNPSSVLYINPDQIHRMFSIDDADFYLLAVSNENLDAENLRLLQEISPAKPLNLSPTVLAIVVQASELCLTVFNRKSEKLYPYILNASCNTLVALIISQYLELTGPAEKPSRYDGITKAFKALLDRDFVRVKKPTEYALALNISTPYLNECVNKATGNSVSHHIQQRVILEAKRLLYHSDKSVKEIAAELGYDDAAYFSRLFTKVSGVTAMAFRNKNFD
ncbi:MAG: AraC family transcriptional regulator [Pedobacter sp.]|nr:MAG: AraC family transcriptional regulator [Pedobacter sp.]